MSDFARKFNTELHRRFDAILKDFGVVVEELPPFAKTDLLTLLREELITERYLFYCALCRIYVEDEDVVPSWYREAMLKDLGEERTV